MSYMMLYKFNSAQNAQLFFNNASTDGLSPTIVTVPSGWVGPSGPSTGIGQPSSQSSDTFSWVTIYSPSPISPYDTYGPVLIFDNSSRQPVFVSPNIDPNSITIMDGQNTIFYKGLPTPDWTPPPPTPLDAPIEFQPIYYPGQDDYWKYLQPVTDQVIDQPLRPDIPFQPDQPFTPDAPVETYDLPPPPPEPPGQAEGETTGPLNIDPNIDPGIFITPPGPVEPIARPPDAFKRFNPDLVTPISAEGGGGPLPAWGCVPGTSLSQPQMFILDNSCSVYTSSNGGNNFCTQTTPSATLADNWVDISIPVNDAASPVPSVVALWNAAVNASYSSSIFDGHRGGVQVILRGQTPGNANILNYSSGTVGVNYASATSGTISANGTILVPVNGSDNINLAYPRISKNFGATFSDVTGLTQGKQWTRACLSQNASVMYIHQYTSFIYKSVDGGTTWTALNGATAPTFPAHGIFNAPGLLQNSMQLRCSKDGSVIAGIEWGGQFYISRDGGTTWTHFDFFTTYSLPNVDSAAFGMATDGSRFLAMIGYFSSVNKVLLLSSSDGGRTWQNISGSVPAFTGLPSGCNITPDGSNAVLCFDATGEVATSLDYGVTWTMKNYTVNPVSGGIDCNACIVPSGSIF